MKSNLQMKVWLFSIGFLCVATAQGQGLVYPPEIRDATVETYKIVDGVELKAWIFQPEGHMASDSIPAMVFFHGGGWRAGSPEQFARQARVLNSRGMVSILADYRVSSRHNSLPENAVEDAKSAMRWVREHAPKFGIDRSRIGAAGGSSGGHLAASTGTLPDFDRVGENQSISSVPNALVLFNPVVIVAPVENVFETPDDLREMMGRSALVDLSPYHHVENGIPPTLILHGTDDELVPYSSVLAFCDLVVRKGSECDVDAYQGAGHGFFNNDPYYDPTVEKMQEFLESLGWLAK